MISIQDIVYKYMSRCSINVEVAKRNVKNRNHFKILDDTTGETFDLGIDKEQLYIKQN